VATVRPASCLPTLGPVFVAIGILVAYLVIVAILWRVTGTRYDALVDSRDHVIKGIVLPIGVGAVFLAIATTLLGWWQPALIQDPRSGPTWALIAPLLFGVVAVLNVATIDFRSPKARVLPLLLVGTLLVGFAEELATRGLPVVGLRDAGASEWVVWLVTSLLFALLHGMNALFGQSVRDTVVQMVTSFLAGTVLYVTRMTTGTLIVAMLLHALWDFGTLGVQAKDREQKPLAGVLALVMMLVGLIAVGFVVTSA
jgi:membrane protease YdiL (CAAX protease family)